jgi:hypothetical protein
MNPLRRLLLRLAVFLAIACAVGSSLVRASDATGESVEDGFPVSLETYGDQAGKSLFDVLAERVKAEPFNLVATVLFLCAILHTFCAGYFRRWAQAVHHAHEARMAAARAEAIREGRPFLDHRVSFRAELLHFFSEVEAIFGLWALPLIVAISVAHGFKAAEYYIAFDVRFTEPMFVVVIMSIASTRPIMRLAEQIMGRVAGMAGGTPAAWWFVILTLGPVLGSFITEPAAMTISALLLARRFYEFSPGRALKYATLGLLFVNVSVGGTLTHFAAPPVLMVAGKWHWGADFMLLHFGWKAAAGIVCANLVYLGVFWREFRSMVGRAPQPRPTEEDGEASPWQQREWPVPLWVTVVHLLFMGWTVLTAHYPALFVGGFLFFLAFVTTTFHHQEDVQVKPALLVGFFLAGLVIHGGLQQWWIEPVLGRLEALPLMGGATVLTAFNDNAAITYLASLVPGFTPEMKYAVVAGAVTGGGLTVIANAPNPAGQSILQRFFDGGVSPLHLLLGALFPTAVFAAAFLLLPF